MVAERSIKKKKFVREIEVTMQIWVTRMIMKNNHAVNLRFSWYMIVIQEWVSS